MHLSEWSVFWGKVGVKYKTFKIPNPEIIKKGFEAIESEDCSFEGLINIQMANLEIEKHPMSFERFRIRRKFKKFKVGCASKKDGCILSYKKNKSFSIFSCNDN